MARSWWRKPSGFILSVLSVLLGLPVEGAISPVEAQVQEELTAGQITEGQLGWDGPTVYLFQAAAAGVLTVVARSQDEADLVLLVTDELGQPIPEGRSDQDLGGDTGAEQFAVTLPRAGTYRVQVETFGAGGGAFLIGTAWLPFPELEVPPDPDGSPDSAIEIQEGQAARDDSLDGSTGDFWDWFVFKAQRAGTLTIATRTEEGDLVLEAFSPGEFTESLERSDQDLQGTGGNEAITLVVQPEQEFFFKVSAFSAGTAVSYRLQMGFIPE